jgi:lipopolysaccharide transport system permease protein
MARIALPTSWAGALAREGGPLRIYQWLWLLLCTVGALVVATPRILSQPEVYSASATAQVQVDAAGRSELFNGGADDPDLQAVRAIALELVVLKQDALQQPIYQGLGSPTLNVRFEPQPDGRVVVVAVAPSGAVAQQLADASAEELVRSVRAAGGREILRGLIGSEMTVALDGGQPSTPFQRLLRDLYRTSAFPLNRPPDLVLRPFTVDQLRPAERSDLARAFEVRDVELSRIDLPNLQNQIRQAQVECPEERLINAESPQLCRDLLRLKKGLEATRGALGYLNGPSLGAAFQPDARSDAYRSARATLPDAPVDRHIAPLLALATLVGLVFGGAGVALDRTAGVMPKLRELWGYRDLIRNLVLRDLRVRYKGSAFGYLWTQLAPLLMMLVFWLVFNFFFQASGAMFPVFLIVGLLPWNFCSEAVVGGTRSMLDNANLIKKVFFPREVLPLVSVFSGMLNYMLSLPMMFLLMAVVQLLYQPLGGRLNFSWTFAYLPVLLVIETIFLTGVVLFTSTLAVFFRDSVHLIGILLQFWFFLTPVVYSLDAIKIQVGGVALATIVRWVNPMASLIDFYHDILYGNTVGADQVPTPGLPALDSVLRVLITALAMLAIGYWFFRRRSGRFGEEI